MHPSRFRVSVYLRGDSAASHCNPRSGNISVNARLGELGRYAAELLPNQMDAKFSKSERREIRALADIAWDRMLRRELKAIHSEIASMDRGEKSPFEVSDIIHEFHDVGARRLYSQFTQTTPWFGVCGAFAQGILTEEDLASASENILVQLKRHIDLHAAE